ncbi:hypothetical protein [Actinophytocola sp. KF-1]
MAAGRRAQLGCHLTAKKPESNGHGSLRGTGVRSECEGEVTYF